MSIEAIVALLGLGVLLLSNLIIITIFVSRLGSRIMFCEQNIKKLHDKDFIIDEELKSLHIIEGKLSTILELLQKK